ncbi:T9SS-dependent choice-of-anchor J family protein [Flavobacterium sp. J27]|uniref:T9SS-dependent choice-of-anchor J family protein n=1 Tax=Flavobacterium sp. J27 TaxID=2060419 RepID=UPI001031F15F|nr:choice-of-anchor J domain-containing protein [Flavobacterium sp. J27]
MKQFYLLLLIALLTNLNCLNAQNYSESFESGVMPSNLTIYNSDADTQWQYTSTASGFGIGNGSIYFDNYTSNENGNYDWVVTPLMNFNEGAILSFDVAYARYDVDYCDQLVVAVSIDNNTSYTQVYDKSCSDLATAPDETTTEFIPTPTQWRTETVDLSAYDNASDVKIAFINISGYGQLLYIDNININIGTLSNEEFNKEIRSLKLYPNPSSDNITISGLEETENYIIYNVVGSKISSGNISNNQLINIQYLKAGIYFIEFENGDTVKFIKE